jgi:hypothetical protein
MGTIGATPYDLSQSKEKGTASTWVSHLHFHLETPFTSENIQVGNVKQNISGIRDAPGVIACDVYRPQMLESLACKDLNQLYAGDQRIHGQYNSHLPNQLVTGNQRGDDKGLAYDPIYPVNTPLEKTPNTFYPWMDSPLSFSR